MFRKPVKQKGKEAKDNGTDMAIIDRNKKAFISYNIERIREIISHLSPEKYELFHTIPFLIHVNGPDFPGYIDHPISAYGIYGFHDSGFWREALKRFKFREKDMLPHLASTYIIKGLYLVGRTGSIAHGEFLDFDYWVVVDEKKTIDIHYTLLKRKLTKISEWGLDEYNQRVNFIILKDEQIRRNTLSSEGKGQSWLAQKTILKEEFYRTFIMIAGQVPVWAVLPPGLDDDHYLKYSDRALKKTSGQLTDSLYIDFGNLGSILKNECPGAILWQLYKAKYDPLKAFVDASLIASYYYEESGSLPCDLVKEKYTEFELTSGMTFPDEVVFDRILKFYQKRSVDKKYDLAKKAIYLIGYRRSLSIDHDDDAPFAKLLSNYVSQWEWRDDKTEPLKEFNKWPEEKKLAFDEAIIENISELYRDVTTKMVDGGQLFSMHHSELQMIKNKISALFQKKKKKIPACSAYLKAKAGAGRLKILCRQDRGKNKKWSCYEYVGADYQYDEDASIFKAGDPMEIIGWTIANRLNGNNQDTVIFEDETGKNLSFVSELFQKAHHFLFEPGDAKSSFFNTDPEFTRLFIAVNSKPDEELLEDASMLIQNSWKEIFFAPLDIKHIENIMLQCYKIGKVISNFYQKTTSRSLQYSIFHNKADDNEYVSMTVEEFVNQFKHDASGKFAINHTETHNHELEDARPFLDTLYF